MIEWQSTSTRLVIDDFFCFLACLVHSGIVATGNGLVFYVVQCSNEPRAYARRSIFSSPLSLIWTRFDEKLEQSLMPVKFCLVLAKMYYLPKSLSCCVGNVSLVALRWSHFNKREFIGWAMSVVLNLKIQFKMGILD